MVVARSDRRDRWPVGGKLSAAFVSGASTAASRAGRYTIEGAFLVIDDIPDLSVLDPTTDWSFDERVRAIVRDGLAARQRDLFSVLEDWTGPALIAATLVAAVSLTA